MPVSDSSPPIVALHDAVDGLFDAFQRTQGQLVVAEVVSSSDSSDRAAETMASHLHLVAAADRATAAVEVTT